GKAVAVGAERIRLNDVGAGFQILPVNLFHDLRLRETQQVEATAQLAPMAAEGRAAIIILVELVAVNGRTHRPIEDEDALREQLFKLCARIHAIWRIGDATKGFQRDRLSRGA